MAKYTVTYNYNFNKKKIYVTFEVNLKLHPMSQGNVIDTYQSTCLMNQIVVNLHNGSRKDNLKATTI